MDWIGLDWDWIGLNWAGLYRARLCPQLSAGGGVPPPNCGSGRGWYTPPVVNLAAAAAAGGGDPPPAWRKGCNCGGGVYPPAKFCISRCGLIGVLPMKLLEIRTYIQYNHDFKQNMFGGLQT